MRARALWTGVALALVTATGIAQTPLPEHLGHVNDLAGVMSSDVASRLGEDLSNHAAAGGAQIAVLTLENPVEESPEELAGRALAIFLQRDPAQRGALLLWTANGHIVVYIGEGLRGEITDAEAQAVIDEIVVPASDAGDVDNALTLGAYSLIMSASGVGGGVGNETAEPALSEPPAVSAPPIAFPQQAAATLGQDLHIMAGAFAADPLAAVSGFFASAEAQARALPDALVGHAPLLLSAPESIVFLGIALAGVVFALNATWRLTRSLPATACALLMASAVLVWLLTRFTELSLLILLSGPVGLIVWMKWGRSTAAVAGKAAPAPTAYEAWIAQQEAKRGAPYADRPQVRPTSPPAPAPAAGSATVSSQAPAMRRMSGLLERAHAAGTVTPAMDRVMARLQTLTSARYKQHRTVMLVALVLLALFFLPLAFVVVAVWIAAELNALRQPNQKLGEFFQQLSREAQALQRFQTPR